MVHSDRKGKDGERELAIALQELDLADGIRRGQQHCGIEGQDVVGVEEFHIECKRVEKININKAMFQSIQDAAPGRIPVVMHRASRAEWLVTMRLSDCAGLLKAARKGGE
jgi:hypothetical protein